jgi:hypothetical protein
MTVKDHMHFCEVAAFRTPLMAGVSGKPCRDQIVSFDSKRFTIAAKTATMPKAT